MAGTRTDPASIGIFVLFRMLSICKGKGELLFVVQSTTNEVFGGYFSQNLEIKSEYFGTGESFVYVVKVDFGKVEK